MYASVLEEQCEWERSVLEEVGVWQYVSLMTSCDSHVTTHMVPVAVFLTTTSPPVTIPTEGVYSDAVRITLEEHSLETVSLKNQG